MLAVKLAYSVWGMASLFTEFRTLIVQSGTKTMRLNRLFRALQFARYGTWNSDFVVNSIISDSVKEFDSPFVTALTNDVHEIDVAFGLISFVFRKKLFFQIEGQWGERLKVPSKSAALLRCVWVDPRYRHQGLLREFVAYLTAHAVERKTAVIVCPRPFEFKSSNELQIDSVYDSYFPTDLTYGHAEETENLLRTWQKLGFTLSTQDPAIGKYPVLLFVPETFEHEISSECHASNNGRLTAGGD